MRTIEELRLKAYVYEAIARLMEKALRLGEEMSEEEAIKKIIEICQEKLPTKEPRES